MKKIFFILLIIILLLANLAYSQEIEETQMELQNGQQEKIEEKIEEKEISPPAVEQIETPKEELSILNAEITPRFQAIDLDRNSSKAQEFRALTEGLFIKNFSLYYDSKSQQISGEFEKIHPLSNLLKDGYWDLSYRRFGLLDVKMGLNKFPHDYANDAKIIFNLENPYTYRVLEDLMEPVPLDVSTGRDNYSLLLKFTPGERLVISTNLSVEERRGRRPFTVESFSSPDETSTAIIEITEPVDYTTTTIDLGLEYIDDTIDIHLNNNLQIFSNNLRDEVIWDNPYQEGAFGLAKVADDYTVHTLSFSPSIKLTDNIRLINTLSYSKITSTIDLVPFTTQQGEEEEEEEGGGAAEGFLRDTLDSDVRSLTFSSILSVRPLSDVRLNIKYRYYTYKNDTPKIDETPPYVMLDGGTTLYTRVPRYMSYNTKTFGFDGAWTITERLFLDAGIEDKDTSRGEREVSKENEKRLFFTLHSTILATILGNLSGRVGYTYGIKSGDYDPTYYKAIYDPGSNVDQHPLMRAFDLSERDSHTIKAGIDYSPIDNLNIGSTLSFVRDEHVGVIIGRRASQGEAISINVQYIPYADLLIYSDYFYDQREIEGSYTWTFDSSLTYPQDPNPLYSNFVNPVTGTIDDTNSVYTIGLDYNINERLSVSLSYHRYNSTGRSLNLPSVDSKTDIYEINTSYKVNKEVYQQIWPFIKFKDIKINAGYYMEIYQRNDYALNFPDPIDTAEDIFLGIREPDYRLSIFSVSISFYF